MLAVYRPCHFYPRGHWGVPFFEDAMLRFIARLWRHLCRLPPLQTISEGICRSLLPRVFSWCHPPPALDYSRGIFHNLFLRALSTLSATRAR